MSKLLHIIASPRGEDSQSTALALAYLEALQAANPDTTIDTLNLWRADLPEFDGDIATIRLQPSLVTGDPAGDMSKALAEARAAASRITP